MTKATAETEKEATVIKDMITSTTIKSDVMDEILQRYSYWKFWRISPWIEISAQLQKVEIGKTVRSPEDQRNREF